MTTRACPKRARPAGRTIARQIDIRVPPRRGLRGHAAPPVGARPKRPNPLRVSDVSDGLCVAVERVRELMDRHVPGALVTGFESLIPGIQLPDPDDRHVVAAAVKTRAEAIVTFNLKDFSEQALAPFGVRAIHPDDFITDLMELNVSSVLEAVRRHRTSLKKPPFSAPDYLD